ncbi:MAG: MBL fold metallo-hydrolase [Prevotella sp.]|nr:MBL fold metallo-hydrolase [Prevotella sp.]
MNIKIHRGLNQIGGCITEIWTDTSRVFIDFGQNLPGNGEPTTPEEDKELVTQIFSQNKKQHEAVFYTHGHEDHVGLLEYIPDNVPQYMSEGTCALLSIKYNVLHEGAVMKYNMLQNMEDGLGDCNDAKNYLIHADRKCKILNGMHVWMRTPPRKKPEGIVIGDIKVTPFFNCHSIYDSHMFLIEAGGKRIWHTGDYREHGYIGKGLLPTLKKYATDIDVLITEGTMLKRDDRCIHECQVSKKMVSVMNAFKYVFVLASATDIERLASINNAAKESRKPLCIWSLFMKKTMEFFSEREAKVSRGLFSFNPLFYNKRLYNRLKRRGFIMVIGTSQIERVRELIQKLPQEETLLIYSSWDGYYKNPEQVQANSKYKEIRDMFHNVVDIHTSGHADRKTIKKVIDTINPKEVICIHKEADAEL